MLTFKKFICSDQLFHEMAFSKEGTIRRIPIKLDSLDAKFINKVYKESKKKVGRGEALEYRYGDMLKIDDLSIVSSLDIGGTTIENIETDIEHLRKKLAFPDGPDSGEFGYDPTLPISAEHRSWNRFVQIMDAQQFGQFDELLKQKAPTNRWQHFKLPDMHMSHPKSKELQTFFGSTAKKRDTDKTDAIVALWDHEFATKGNIFPLNKSPTGAASIIQPDKHVQIKNFNAEMWDKYKDAAEEDVMKIVKAKTGVKSIIKSPVSGHYFVDVGDTGAADAENQFKVKGLTADDVEEMVNRSMERLKNHSGASEFINGKRVDFSDSEWRKSKIATIVRSIDKRAYLKHIGAVDFERVSTNAKSSGKAYIPSGPLQKVTSGEGDPEKGPGSFDKAAYTAHISSEKSTDKHLNTILDYVDLRADGEDHMTAMSKIPHENDETTDALEEIGGLINKYNEFKSEGLTHRQAIAKVIKLQSGKEDKYLDSKQISIALDRFSAETAFGYFGPNASKELPVPAAPIGSVSALDPIMQNAFTAKYYKLIGDGDSHEEAVEEILSFVSKHPEASKKLPEIREFLNSLNGSEVAVEGFMGWIYNRMFTEMFIEMGGAVGPFIPTKKSLSKLGWPDNPEPQGSLSNLKKMKDVIKDRRCGNCGYLIKPMSKCGNCGYN